jgi:ribosomal protein L32
MAVPKRTSKSKTNKRKTVWKRIALKQSVKAYSLYSICKEKITNGDS